MNPIEILQSQILMFCTERKLKNLTRLPEVPKFESEWNLKRSLQRYEKLKNSLSLYYGEQVSQELRKGIDHHVKNFKQFVCRLYEGELNTFLEEVKGNDFSKVKT